MPVAFDLDHIFVEFLSEILKDIAANRVPYLTVFGQRFAEIPSNEFYFAGFLGHSWTRPTQLSSF